MLFSSSFFAYSFQQCFAFEQLLEQKTRAAQISLPLYNSLIFFNNSINRQLYSLPPSFLTSLKVLGAFSSYSRLRCLFLKCRCCSCPCCITRSMRISSFPAAPVPNSHTSRFSNLSRNNPKQNQKLRTKTRSCEISG